MAPAAKISIKGVNPLVAQSGVYRSFCNLRKVS